MPDPLGSKGETAEALALVVDEAQRYLQQLDRSPVRLSHAEEAAARFDARLPEDGSGALKTLRQLIDDGLDAAIRSSGPRFFHFIVGGTTPAALAADWLTSALDQNPGMWVASPLGARLEVVVVGWLKELFGLPADWGGVLTTGAQMANFTGLACGRRWWGLQHALDVDEQGLANAPQMPVFTSGLVHPSALKAVGMLGIGRAQVKNVVRDGVGRLDDQALETELRRLQGAPALLIATAGEPNAGLFDPIARMADLAERYNCWLHVDGAFGLFAALTPASSRLIDGIERAHSVIADGHKWGNVPYDSAFAFVRDRSLMSGSFGIGAAYLSPVDDEQRPNTAYLSPESSRRARALALWASLAAYGRKGYEQMIARHLELAQYLARRVDERDDLERLADVPLNVVCFRYRRHELDEPRTNELNRRLGEAILQDGRVFVGTTVFDGKVGLRPAIVNWMTTEDDIDTLVEVVLELGQRAERDKGISEKNALRPRFERK